MKSPLVSVIVPTYNSSEFLEACLISIQNQTYKNIELIVVDNNSTDDTKEIARKFTEHVYNKGPERSAQRNYGVKKSSGEYVAIIDSDMELTRKVIESCVSMARQAKNLAGIIIPEESFGEGFWAQCKKLERSFYVGVDWIEAARFYPKTLYEGIGGYSEDMVSGEDWDLSQRAAENGIIVRTDQFIMHNEGHPHLLKLLKKKYYYARQIRAYSRVGQKSKFYSQSNPFKRYSLFLSRPIALFTNPIRGLGMLILKFFEFGVGFIGVMSSLRYSSRPTLIDFIGVGAEKAGTTWVAEMLGEHPDVRLSVPKELNFFNEYMNHTYKKRRNVNYTRGLAWYLGHFSPYSPRSVIGEFSTYYLFDQKAPKRIKQHFPEIKIIICLREPVSRAHSEYVWHKYNTRLETKSEKEALEIDSEYIQKSKYNDQISRYLKYFKRENIFVLTMDQIKDAPEEVTKALYRFLGVDAEFVPRGMHNRSNPARASRFPRIIQIINTMSDRLNTQSSSRFIRPIVYSKPVKKIFNRITYSSIDYPKLDQKTATRLKRYFESDINSTEALLGIDLSSWKS